MLATGLMFSAGSSAQSEYYRHVIFDSSGHLDIYGPRDNYNPSQQ